MNIGGVNPSASFQPSSPQAGGGVERQIRQLEQRLDKLGKEKRQAEKVHDREKAEKLQNQMEELQRRIQLLKQRQKPKAEESGETPGEEENKSPSGAEA